MTTAWMWLDEATGRTMGVQVDVATGRLRWLDQIGCHCDEGDLMQTAAEYRQRGAPGPIGEPPADVVAALGVTLAALAGGGGGGG